MNKRTRILIVLTALAVAFVLLSSLAFIVLEADHDCAGEGCQICCCIENCENLLRQLTGALTVSFGIVAAIYALGIVCSELAKEITACTPITLKVKLSD